MKRNILIMLLISTILFSSCGEKSLKLNASLVADAIETLTKDTKIIVTGDIDSLTNMDILEALDDLEKNNETPNIKVSLDLSKTNYSSTTLYFNSCHLLKRIVLPDNLTEIQACAFENCTSLIEIQIPNTVTKIDRLAFTNCTSLKQISIPENVSEIVINAFRGCKIKELKHPCITIHNGFIIEDGLLIECTNQESKISIPQGIIKVDDYAFCNCNLITEIDMPNSITKIGNSAFVNCNALNKVSLSKNISEIGDSAFRNCNLTSIVIPDSVEDIGNNAFAKCKSLRTVTVPLSFDLEPDNIKSVFKGCENITFIQDGKKALELVSIQ